MPLMLSVELTKRGEDI